MVEIPEPKAPKPTPEPSSWLSLRVFYLRLSRCELDETMLDSLTISHAALTSDTVLEVNGDRPSTGHNGHVSCPLRRDRVDAASREASFVSTATVRMAGSVRFEVRVGGGERLLVGIMETCGDVAGEEEEGWVMKCQVAMQRCSGFLKGEGAKSPMVEVYVASLFRGNPIVFTKAMKLRLARGRTRRVKAPFMEPIPECAEHADDDDAKGTPPDQKHDPHCILRAGIGVQVLQAGAGHGRRRLRQLVREIGGPGRRGQRALVVHRRRQSGRRHQPGHLPRRRHRRWTPGSFLPVHLQEYDAAVDLRPTLTLNGRQHSSISRSQGSPPDVTRLEITLLDVFVDPLACYNTI